MDIRNEFKGLVHIHMDGEASMLREELTSKRIHLENAQTALQKVETSYSAIYEENYRLRTLLRTLAEKIEQPGPKSLEIRAMLAAHGFFTLAAKADAAPEERDAVDFSEDSEDIPF